MDQLYEEIKHFITVMTMFNNSVAQQWDSLQRAFEEADSVWSEQGDQARREFENKWSQMAAALRQYKEKHSEAYLMFLIQRKNALDEYFGY